MPSFSMRFECQAGCTRCCDKSGFVYLTEEDSTRIAAHLGLSLQAFEAQYVFRTKKLRRLRIPRNRQCEFLGRDGCRIHSVKPLQCRTYPFWPGLIDSRSSWSAEGRFCPGIGKGELVNIQSARAQAEETRLANPHLYS